MSLFVLMPAKAAARDRRNQSLLKCRFALPLLLLGTALIASPVHAETDPESGLVIAPGFEQVKAQCTACHSGRLVAQNRADREGWLQMIRWMQETQNLWPLGPAEPVILDYLATHYAPLPRGRRAPLGVSFGER